MKAFSEVPSGDLAISCRIFSRAACRRIVEEAFRHAAEHDYKSVTAGKLPAGIKQKSFIDEDGDWAIAISVYSASMTARAENAGAENRAASGKLNQRKRASKQTGKSASSASSGRSLSTKGGLKENAENPKGPSGQVTKDSSL